jgi:2,3-bisphosphoglycerate-dependent phosphoglycerate mutase
MSKLILLRHGQSVWNQWNVFTGWVDVPLSSQGIEEAFAAGKLIRDIPIDVIFTTPLIRASMTAMLAMSVHSSHKVPVIKHTGEGKMEEWGKIFSVETMEKCIPVIPAWQLNERMYGELQGLNKAELAKKYGPEQVHIWRRSFDVSPPGGESLEMTAARTIPYFEENIFPHLIEGRNVFVSAHGNSLRSIIMRLDGLSKEEVVALELPTGLPIIYDYNNGEYLKQ